MIPEGDAKYKYTTYMVPGAEGVYFFLNDTAITYHEIVPPLCAGDSTRTYHIPSSSRGEIIAFKWGKLRFCKPVCIINGCNWPGEYIPVQEGFTAGSNGRNSCIMH